MKSGDKTQGPFNRASRRLNILRTSSAGLLCQVVTGVLGFVYRTAFIAVLSAEYLGINGLFWSVLTILSLADLGIGDVIAYRFYAPIACGDLPRVRSLMAFFRSVYHIVAGVVLVLGMCIYPFLGCLVKDSAEIPADVNLQLVYVLYLAQSVGTYLFAYRMSIWGADQKTYVGSFIRMASETARIVCQLAVLYVTRSFTLTLAASIVVTIACNIGFSLWTTRVYAEVFKPAPPLSVAERWAIFKESGALLCHRVGSTVIESTDGIVLTRCVSLAATGLYSNYYIVMKTMQSLLHAMLGGFTSVFGNVNALKNTEEQYLAFQRMQLPTLAVVGGASVCFALLADGFVSLWLGPDLALGAVIPAVMGVQAYLTFGELNITANVSARGLFVYDKPRPLIQSLLNLGISMFLAFRYGIVGVFLGTVISFGLTGFWRAPLILFRHGFGISVWRYWLQYLSYTGYVVSYSVVAGVLVQKFFPTATSWLGWLAEAVMVGLGYCLGFVVVFCRTEAFRFTWHALVDRRAFR